MKLSDIRALIEAATPGPWSVHGRYVFAGSDGEMRGRVCEVPYWEHGENIALIAASRALMPKLLAVAEVAEIFASHASNCRTRMGVAYDPDGEPVDTSVCSCGAGDLSKALAALEAE